MLRNSLPVLQQAEAAECGLVCITMIAKYYGHNIDLNSMRSRYPVSLRGTDLVSINKTANAMSLNTRAIKVELENLDKLRCPAILHWNLDHFVVLKSVNNGNIVIHDPARGKCKVSKKEVSANFTGVALELFPATSFEKRHMRTKMKLSTLWENITGLKRAIIQTIILSVVLQIVTLVSPFYLQLVVDQAIASQDTSLLVVLAAAFIGVALIKAFTTMFRSWIVLFLGYQLSFQLIGNIFRHLLFLPIAYFEKRHVGDVMSRMASTKPLQKALSESFVVAMIDGLMTITAGIIIFNYSIKLGFLVLAFIVGVLLLNLIIYPTLRQRQEEELIYEASTESHVIESIRGASTIKLFNSENKRLTSWSNLYADTISAKLATGKLKIILTTFDEIANSLQVVLIVFIGANMILSESFQFSIGMLFAFMAYRDILNRSASSLVSKLIELRLLSLHLDRISDIVLTKKERHETDGLLDLANDSIDPFNVTEGVEIKLIDVSFRYSDYDPWVLKGVNLIISAGEFVVITGLSGGGKTTLMKLILGLYPPTEGKILINDVELNSRNYHDWRRVIGVVMQDDQLLTGNLTENISFFDPDVSIPLVKESAYKASVDDEIEKMPMKYSSLVGDMGSVLSGGQKQRILLARALYKKPGVLVLDEGTANIDSTTEKIIVETVKEMKQTRLIIAHRRRFIDNADKVYILSDGVISET